MYSTETTDNEIINNLIVSPGAYDLYMNDGILATSPSDAYINLGNGVTATVANNVHVMDIDSAGFTNYAGEDYTLTANSPAVDQGQQVVTANIFYDFLGASRQQGNETDAGAYEFVPVNNSNARKAATTETETETTSSNPVIATDAQNLLSIYPNPATDFVNVQLDGYKGENLTINVYDQTGKVVLTQDYQAQEGIFIRH